MAGLCNLRATQSNRSDSLSAGHATPLTPAAVHFWLMSFGPVIALTLRRTEPVLSPPTATRRQVRTAANGGEAGLPYDRRTHADRERQTAKAKRQRDAQREPSGRRELQLLQADIDDDA